MIREFNNCPVRLTYKLYFFSQRIIFFSHNKLVNNTFSHSLSAKQTGQTSRSSSTSGIVVSAASAAAASPLPNAKSSTFFKRYLSWVHVLLKFCMPKAPSLFVVLDKWEISLAARLMPGLLVSNRLGPTYSRPPYTVWSRLIHRVERFGTKSHDPPRGGAKEGLGQHKHIFYSIFILRNI